MRVKLNPKGVFYYNNGSHSMKSHLFDWKGICDKYGWDHESVFRTCSHDARDGFQEQRGGLHGPNPPVSHPLAQ